MQMKTIPPWTQFECERCGGRFHLARAEPLIVPDDHPELCPECLAYETGLAAANDDDREWRARAERAEAEALRLRATLRRAGKRLKREIVEGDEIARRLEDMGDELAQEATRRRDAEFRAEKADARASEILARLNRYRDAIGEELHDIREYRENGEVMNSDRHEIRALRERAEKAEARSVDRLLRCECGSSRVAVEPPEYNRESWAVYCLDEECTRDTASGHTALAALLAWHGLNDE